VTGLATVLMSAPAVAAVVDGASPGLADLTVVPAVGPGAQAGVVAGTTPPPDQPREFVPGDVTPGFLGFLMIFVVALAAIPIFLSMTGKLRRVRREGELEEQQAPPEDGGREG
jgi:hypothetical protein